MNNIEKSLDILKRMRIVMFAHRIDGDNIAPALDDAIAALEKQVGKEAEYHHRANGKCALTICPNCKSRVAVAEYIFPVDTYCRKCGQRYVVDIRDWSVEE